MKKVLVTGGSGYIGSHTIIELLRKKDLEVISIDNYSNSNDNTYERIKNITGSEITYHPIDICDLNALKKVFSLHPDISGIIHFAAFKSVGESVEKPLKYYSNNLNGLINLLRVCKEYKVNNFIFSSSCSVYGNTSILPVTESTPFAKAESPYANTKQMGEEIIEHFVNANPNIKVISLRYFNPAGAHQSGLNGELPIGKPSNLVPAITQFAIGKINELLVNGTDYTTRDGSCVRDFIHISDLAEAHVMAIEKLFVSSFPFYKVYNLGTGNGVTVLEAIEAFEKISGKKLNYKVGPRRVGDVVEIFSDNTLVKNDLGWVPTRGIEDIMDTAWKWEIFLSSNSK
ncbi:MAG: UDP-glucose 4-epimerase GalE [Bacteroidota bacterium]|jgi:UDP-glucose 4-epimerase